jgi:hypothetical protein
MSEFWKLEAGGSKLEAESGTAEAEEKGREE